MCLNLSSPSTSINLTQIKIMLNTVFQFFDACQPFGYPLLACSVIMVAAILYHLIFTGSRGLLRQLIHALEQAREHGTDPVPVLTDLCLKSASPVAAEVLYATRHGGDEHLEQQMEARLRVVVDAERTGMATISVITNIAPMLGILGTAWGLVKIFGVFGAADAGPGIAMGISTALYTTIFGLAIAVPGIIALTCFERSLEQRAARLNHFFTELLAILHK